MTLRLRSVLLAGGLAAALPAAAAPAPADYEALAARAAAPERPKIALVLSGGGARGLAHVGVFKALERLRVPWDCIVGTSMGAIAGGTIAAGTSVAEAERQVVEADWRYVFADKPRRSDVPYFRKREDYRNYFDFTLTLRDLRLSAPRNVAGVQNIGLFFRELTQAAWSEDFDTLPVPYRAVGTDIVTGEAVLLREGMVAEAMRASMTVPGVFPAIPYKGHLLVDGGIANNLPVSEGRALCGDVVIAVDVSTPVLKLDELDSFLSVGAQVIGVSMQRSVNEELATLTPRDVFIVPALDGYSPADFMKVRELIALGEQAVESRAEQLRPYQLSAADYAAWQAQVAARRTEPPVIAQVQSARTRWVNPRVLAGLLEVEKGQPLDLPALHQGIKRIYARNDFTSIGYELRPAGEGAAALHILPEERPGRDFVRFGVSLFADFEGQAEFSALASLRRAWLNRLDAEWRTELEIGRDLRLATEWYQPLRLQSEFFVAPFLRYQRDFRDSHVSGSLREYELRSTEAGFELGSVFGRWGEFRAGVLGGRLAVRADAGLPYGDYAEDRGGFTLRASYDQLDDVALPQQGTLLRVDYFRSREALGGEDDYQRLAVEARQAFSFGRNSVLLVARGGSSLDTDTPFHEHFTLGGPFNLSAYGPRELEAPNQLYARTEAYRRVSDLPSMVGRGIYAGGLVEAGFGWANGEFDVPRTADLPWSAGAYLAADTVVGPLYLLGAVNDREDLALYLALGINF